DPFLPCIAIANFRVQLSPTFPNFAYFDFVQTGCNTGNRTDIVFRQINRLSLRSSARLFQLV
ncbi:MAG: hypothetical protein ACRCYO_16710, partial [Bacteroidia bacterium]